MGGRAKAWCLLSHAGVYCMSMSAYLQKFNLMMLKPKTKLFTCYGQRCQAVLPGVATFMSMTAGAYTRSRFSLT
jgi:hypothetical protein